MTQKQKIKKARNLTLFLLFLTPVYWFNGAKWFSGLIAIAAIFSFLDILRMLGINRKTKIKVIWDKNPPKFLQKFPFKLK